MSYLNDPNTHRLATFCCLCGKELRDAVSVEVGIGPVCRDRAGYAEIPSEHRPAVNKLIHRAGVAAEDGNTRDVLGVATEIAGLGFVRVANTIRDRFIPLKVWHDHAAPVTRWNRDTKTEEIVEGQTRHAICVATPFSESANATRRDFIRGRHRPVKNGRDFHWQFDADQQRNLFAWLAKNFGGSQGFALADDERGTDARVFDLPTWGDFTAANFRDQRGNWQRNR